MFKLFFSPLNKNYFSKDKINCSGCNKKSNPLFFFIFWKKKGVEHSFLCGGCCKVNKQKFGSITEQKILILVDNLPEDSLPIYIRPPELQTSKNNIDVFQAADIQLGCEIVKDKTVHAGRGSIFGAIIGKSLEELDLKQETDGLKLLDMIIIEKEEE